MAVVDYKLGVAQTLVFADVYPIINKVMMEQAESQDSRYGPTKEIATCFKTEIWTPQARCTGGYYRDTNVFFQLAEALWIWAGRKDVDFLTKFNSKMGEFSDNGNVFHAPYGFRMRNYGVDTRIDDNSKGLDQIEKALKMLEENPDDRRVVVSVWNPELDLGTQSKDIPCNDLIMYKIRNGRLRCTIANRSNDLHWGLSTNVFQFSFISEIMASILGIRYGTQIHNSDSLHLYTKNEIAQSLYTNFRDYEKEDLGLYKYCKWSPIDFDFPSNRVGIEDKLRCVDMWINAMIDSLDENEMEEINLDGLRNFSDHLYRVYKLLELYLAYKKETIDDNVRHDYLIKASRLYVADHCEDYHMMAMNFFARRITAPEKKGALDSMRIAFPNIGRF